MAYKYTFFDDYSEAAHPLLFEALQKNNLKQELGYGNDEPSREAAAAIKKHIGKDQIDIHFVSCGTQANMLAAAAMLESYESVIAPNSGHVNVHEAGAIESIGHKIHAVESREGKLTPDSILETVKLHTDEHMVKPKAVFIAQSTEIGTIYSKKELESISKVCRGNGLYFYIDGARIGSALTSSYSDFELGDIAGLADAFYIGGTKNGAMLGEAFVIINEGLKNNFRYHIKQRGALLAKGRIIGAQFYELFKENLFFDLARHANKLSEALAKGIKECGFSFLNKPVSNQIFPILPDELIEKLGKLYGFYVWSKVDEKNSTIRLVTSWATDEEKVKEFLDDLKRLSSVSA